MSLSLYGGGSPASVAERIQKHVSESALSCEIVGYKRRTFGGGEMHFIVFEKYFMRTSSRASLSVVVSGRDGEVYVDAYGSGGGTGTFMRFSWGAEDSFEDEVRSALAPLGFREI